MGNKIRKTEEIDQKNMKTDRITKKDIILMLIITFIYAIISFINLGSLTNPQTFWETEYAGDYITFKIEHGKSYVSNIRYYSGCNFGNYSLSFSYDGINYSKPLKLSTDNVFEWKDLELNRNFEYIKLVGNEAGIYLGEIAIYDGSGNKLSLTPINENSKLVLDEQDTVPEEISYLNSTYFDEIYFARTAYEHLHNLPAYEWVHPPLGKLLMAIPIMFLGMTTFAYRLMGNIAGILMIPTIYVFAKMLFKNIKYAVLAAIIMAADGMHFVQSRLGTADSFLVLFIMLEYLFMYKYILTKDTTMKKRLLYLFLSGLFMGAAISVKWSGVFAAIGLALVFFLNLIRRFLVNKEKWTKEDSLIILSCFGFFVLIPLIIYLLSYIPFYIVENAYIKDLKTFIEWQQYMYNYHHDLVATHPYSSMWYTWPIGKQSILYWVGTTNDGAITRIVLLGNPAIWWFSIPCMIFTFISTIKNRKFEYLMLLIPIICMMMSYFGIDRIMFLYHYFPVLPFVMLTIVAFMKWLSEKFKTDIFIYIFVIVIIIVFVKFYPIYSGLPTTEQYIKDLQWLDTWIW